jgi:hypothetical protein
MIRNLPEAGFLTADDACDKQLIASAVVRAAQMGIKSKMREGQA